MPTPEEMARMQESRIKSDATLLEEGASCVANESGDVQLNLTEEQKNKAKKEMEYDMDSVKYKVKREYYNELNNSQLEEIDERENELLELEPERLEHLIEQMATLGVDINGATDEMDNASKKAKDELGGGYEDKNHSVNTSNKGGSGTVRIEK